MTETCDTCSTCFYYRPNNHTNGHCRIHPPIPRDAHPDEDGPFDPEGCWPRVNAHDWCGEHAAPTDNQPTPRPWLALTIAGLTAAAGARIIQRATR